MDLKRTEKLVSALYLLTSFFDEKEPMKWRLRQLGGLLVSQKESNNVVLEVRSLLAVAKNAGLISDANFDIIHAEFGKMLPVESFENLLAPAEEPESVEAPLPVRNEERVVERPTYVERPEPKPAERTYLLDTTASSRPVIKDKSDKTREPRQVGAVAIKKNSRQTVILSLLKKKKEIQIADVTPLIPGVSEKTIQRELLAMVAAGILRKIGEKRWSRYTLAE